MTGAPDQTDNPRVLETVTTTFDLIELLEESNGAEAAEIAEELDISLSSVYNHLTTLSRHDFLLKNGNSYELSYRFITLGEYVRHQSPLYQHGREQVDKLKEEIGEYAHLTVEQNGLGINLYKTSAKDAVGSGFETARVQKPDYLHYTATGKSILAYLPDDRVESILDRHGLPERTDRTITTREALFDELETVREQGYAYNDGEEVRGIRAVGAPILTPDNDVLGAISVSGPESHLHEKKFEVELPSRVKSAANVIEVNLNTSVEESDFPSF